MQLGRTDILDSLDYIILDFERLTDFVCDLPDRLK